MACCGKCKKSGGRPKRGAVGLFLAVVLCAALVGCDEEKKQQIRDAAHKAILEYVETKGQQQASDYVDKLVADGKLGAENAARIKAAIPQGVDKLRDVMGEVEQDEEAEK